MSVRSIEAEVSIKSGVQAECTIGREVIVEVHDDVTLDSLTVTANGQYEPSEGVDGFDSVTVAVPPTIPDIEPLTVTANGTYTAEGDGFNPVTVNVEAPKDPNVCEGAFTATETGVLTIDTGYEGDSYPKAVIIRPVSGVMQTDDDFYRDALRYAINFILYFKANTTAPTYASEPSGAENQVRYTCVRKSSLTEYGNTQASSAYIYTTASNEGMYNIESAVRIPDNHTLKVVVTSTQNTAFATGVKYKYQVFY